MKILAAVFRTYGATVAIKYCIVGYLYFVVQVDQLLDVLEFVFHVVSLSDVADDACVEALDHKLERTNTKGVSWLENMMLLWLQHFVKTARLLWIHVQVSKHETSFDFIVIDLKMMTANFFTLQLHEEFLLASFRVHCRLAKLDRHVVWIEEDLSLERTSDKLEHKHFLVGLIICLDIDFCVALH